MKRNFIVVLILPALLFAASTLGARETKSTIPAPTLQPVLLHELVVTVVGVGRVESNQENFFCENNTTCRGYYLPGTLVALHAIPVSGNTDIYDFGGWGGECGGTVAACAVLMDDDKELTAYFITPAFLLLSPDTKTTIPYHPPAVPSKSPDPSTSKPVAVGNYADGFSLLIGLPPFADPVDMYLGLTIPGHDDIYYFNSDNYLVSQASGVVLWKVGVSDAINETVLNKVPVDFPLFPFPRGLYLIHLIVTPAGNLDHYYHWRTAFVVHDTVFPIQ